MKRLDFAICGYCPKLCRHVCPVAVGTARERATPTAMMLGPLLWMDGVVSEQEAVEAVALCTSCGACTRACALHQPVSDLVNQALTELTQPPSGDAPAITGDHELVCITLGTDWSDALAAHLGRPVSSVSIKAEGPVDPEFVIAMSHRTAVTPTRSSLQWLDVAGVACEPLASFTSGLRGPGRIELAPCGHPTPALSGSLLCCGAGEPLMSHHPDLAREVAASWFSRHQDQPMWTADAKCGEHLRSAGLNVADPVVDLLSKGVK